MKNNEMIDSAISVDNKAQEEVKISIPELKERLDKMSDSEWLDYLMKDIEETLQIELDKVGDKMLEHPVGVRTFLDAEELKRRAEHYFESRGEDTAKEVARQFSEQISPFLEKVQEMFRQGEIAKYKERGVKEVFEEVDEAIGALINEEEGDEALEKIKAALTTSALYCYPSYRINKALTEKELAFIATWFHNTGYEITIEKANILAPILEQVFCRREVTVEYEKQSLVFAAIEEYLTILAKNFKDYGEKAKSLKLLQVRGTLACRHDTYLEKLSDAQAEAIIEAIKSAREDLKLEAAYAEL